MVKDIRDSDKVYAEERQLNKYIREHGRPDQTVCNLDAVQFRHDTVANKKVLRIIEHKHPNEKPVDKSQMIVLRELAECCLANETDDTWQGGVYVITCNIPVKDDEMVKIVKIASKKHSIDREDEERLWTKDIFERWLDYKN